MIYSVERSTKIKLKKQWDAALVWRKKQVICNFNKCSFCAMAGLKPDWNSS